MKRISLSVSGQAYKRFKQLSRRRDRPVSELIREAMARYLQAAEDDLQPLRQLQVFAEPKALGDLPDRSELWDEINSAPIPSEGG